MNKLFEVVRCNRLMPCNKGLAELLKEDAFFLQSCLYHVRQVLRAQAEFQQRLIVLPTADPGEYRDEQRKEQRHRQGDIGGAAAPQGARLAEEHSIRGSTTSTPSVSPIHQVNQLVGSSGVSTLPSTHMPASDNDALVRHMAGDMTRKRRRSRALSKAAG